MVISKILVTGGTGFVGHWMQQTEPEGLDVTYINRQGYGLWYWWTMEWDAIVHLAPISPEKVISCAARNNARLLYCSSGIVYHPENDTEYRQNKIKWEQECLDSGADTVIARLFAFYGERLTDDHAIVAFENAAKANTPLTIWGDGSTVRSYMRGEDLGRWMWAILLKGIKGEAYDVGGDKPITMIELARAFLAVYESTSTVEVLGGKDAMPVYLPPDTDKTRRLLDG